MKEKQRERPNQRKSGRERKDEKKIDQATRCPATVINFVYQIRRIQSVVRGAGAGSNTTKSIMVHLVIHWIDRKRRI